MSLLPLQPSIKQEGTDVIEDLPSVKKCRHPKCICNVCGRKFSAESLLTNNVNLCNNVDNPDRLDVDATTVKKEETDSTDVVDEQVTFELTSHRNSMDKLSRSLNKEDDLIKGTTPGSLPPEKQNAGKRPVGRPSKRELAAPVVAIQRPKGRRLKRTIWKRDKNGRFTKVNEEETAI